MPQRNVSLESYISLTDVIKECKEEGIEISLKTLKWRIDHGKISSIRDLHDIRKRRLIPVEEIPNIIVYFSQLSSIQNEYPPLSKLAEKIGLKKRSLHQRAEKLGIETIMMGNERVMEKREYDKWGIILNKKQKREKDYVSTEFVGKQFGVSHNLIIYRIKQGIIPTVKIESRYKILKKDFEEHGDEWKKRCNYVKNHRS